MISNKRYIGAHIDNSDYVTFENKIKKIKQVGGNIVQIFEPTYDITKNIKQITDKNKVKIVIHSSYMHNIANNWDTDSWWIKGIIKEIKTAAKLNAFGVVLHFGKYKDLPKHKAINNMFTSLLHIHNSTINENNVKIILETSTGQGTEMCYTLDELSYFYKKIHPIHNRIGLCIDTCHIFSAGYDIRTKKDVLLYLEAFEELIGINKISLIHLNDSKVKLGEKKDRHESIGEGYIGFNGLKMIFDYFYNMGIPIILETPNNSYIKEIPQLQ